MEELIIIGGGVAGLSCLNALLDSNIAPLLIEENQIGTPKVCGEFIAPYASQQLEKWQIGSLESIERVNFVINEQEILIKFPTPAGAFSREQAELLLAKRALRMGGNIKQGISLQSIEPPLAANNFCYKINLSSGECILSKQVIFATGKIKPPIKYPLPMPFAGFKLHLPEIITDNTLYMFTYPGAYFGVVPISKDTSNLTCLAKRKVFEQMGCARNFLIELANKNSILESFLKNISLDDLTILKGFAPDFKIQTLPDWKNAYWIGDSIASFYPAIGYGFAHSIHSALMAAHYFRVSNSVEYNIKMKQEMRYTLWLGKLLHHLLINKPLNMPLKYFLNRHPILINYLMNKLGYQQF